MTDLLYPEYAISQSLICAFQSSPHCPATPCFRLLQPLSVVGRTLTTRIRPQRPVFHWRHLPRSSERLITLTPSRITSVMQNALRSVSYPDPSYPHLRLNCVVGLARFMMISTTPCFYEVLVIHAGSSATGHSARMYGIPHCNPEPRGFTRTRR